MQRVKRQFGLDQEMPGSLKESVPSSPSLAPFIKDRAFAYWKGKVNRMMIPSGHRFDFNTVSINAYWQRLAYAMAGYVKSGRGNKAPISNYCKLQISSPCFYPSSRSAIAYRNSQKLGFAKWDETRSVWIVYTTHFPKGLRESVNVVEKRLVMLSKRGKWAKRDAPVNSTMEKSFKKRARSPKKTPLKKTKAGKKKDSATPVPELEKESSTTSLKKVVEFVVAPIKAKGVVIGSPKRKFATVPTLEGVEKQAIFSNKVGKKSVTLRSSEDQRKFAVSPSSLKGGQQSVVPAHSSPKKKKSIVPPFGASTRTRSKSASVVKQAGSKVSFFSLFVCCFYFAILFCIFLFFHLRQAMHKFGEPSGVVVEVILKFPFVLISFLGQICIV